METTYEEPEDAEFWRKASLDASVGHVAQVRNGYRFARADPIFFDGKRFDVIYSHGVSMKLFRCDSAHADIRCGYCGEKRGDECGIVYYWIPVEIDNELLEIPSDAEVDEAMSGIREKLEPCRAEGFREMESSEILFLGNAE